MDNKNNLAESASTAIGNVDQLTTEIGDAGIFDDPNVSDPGEALRLKRQKIEGEHQGLRGVFNYSDDIKRDAEAIRQSELQKLGDSDAAAARQAKLQGEQSDDRIAAFREEAKEAQLRGEGRNDDARVAGLDFSTQQRVRSLQEQADAETDPTRKAQLQREIAAANDAGKIERDALPQELQHVSQMANSGLNALHGSDFSNLSDAVRKLDATTTKLDKVLANAKTLVLLKD